MNAVAPPPSVHSISRSWNGGGQVALDSMSSEIFLPRNKGQQRYGSLSGHSPASSSENNAMSNSLWASSLKKKGTARAPGGAGGGVGTNGSTLGGWPKSDVASRSNGMGPGVATQSPSLTNGIHQPNPILPSQHLANSQMQNGHTQPSFLVLLPLNGTFERKQIPLPYFSETLRIGRQTNTKTTPTQSNGYFDSKVLSRQHAEVWADKETNKVWIRDIKSSNGTFVNGQRLSQENQASEPHELRTDDVLELGIDIVGEDSKTIIHHKVAARVEHAGAHVGNVDLSFAEVEPLVNGSLMAGNHGSAPNGVRGRTNSQNSTRTSVANGMTGPNHRQAPMIMAPVSMEMVVKKLNHELYTAKQQSEDLHRTTEIFDVLLSSSTSPEKLESAEDKPVPHQTNGVTETKPPFSPLPPQPMTELSRAGTPDMPRAKSEKSLKLDPPQQMLSLVGELARVRKEAETNSARIQDLEDALKKEKLAREVAEDRAAMLENVSRLLRGKSREHILQQLDNEQCEIEKSGSQNKVFGEKLLVPEDENKRNDSQVTVDPVAVTATESAAALQSRMEKILEELRSAKEDVEAYKHRVETAEQRADGAEQKADSDRKSLMDTIRTLRKEQDERNHRMKEVGSQTDGVGTCSTGVQVSVEGPTGNVAAGIIRTDSGGPPITRLGKEQTMLLRKENAAPYASVLGVVLLGVGIMAAINNWQRAER